VDCRSVVRTTGKIGLRLGLRFRIGLCYGINSADKLSHHKSVTYSVEFVLLNKQQFSGGRACLN